MILSSNVSVQAEHGAGGLCPKKSVWNFQALEIPAFIGLGEFQTPFFGTHLAIFSMLEKAALNSQIALSSACGRIYVTGKVAPVRRLYTKPFALSQPCDTTAGVSHGRTSGYATVWG